MGVFEVLAQNKYTRWVEISPQSVKILMHSPPKKMISSESSECLTIKID